MKANICVFMLLANCSA